MSEIFCALVQFPHSAYFEINKALEGKATIDSLTREDDHYNANIEFPRQEMSECLRTVIDCDGLPVEIIPKTTKGGAVPSIRKYMNSPAFIKRRDEGRDRAVYRVGKAKKSHHAAPTKKSHHAAKKSHHAAPKKSHHAAKSNGATKMKRADRGSQMEKLKEHLSNWTTIGDLQKATGVKNSTIYTTFARLGKSIISKQDPSKQGGRGNRKVYRLAAAAA